MKREMYQYSLDFCCTIVAYAVNLENVTETIKNILKSKKVRFIAELKRITV